MIEISTAIDAAKYLKRMGGRKYFIRPKDKDGNEQRGIYRRIIGSRYTVLCGPL